MTSFDESLALSQEINAVAAAPWADVAAAQEHFVIEVCVCMVLVLLLSSPPLPISRNGTISRTAVMAFTMATPPLR